MALILSLPGIAQEPAQQAVQVRFYDHHYGDFGGEFASTGSLLRCPYNPETWVFRMVADSLEADTVLGKKIPRSGPGNTCPVSLEKWFDPAESRLTACRDLVFRNVAASGRPVWAFNSEQFFPIDSLSTEPNRGAAPLSHDYAFCMEINAGFIQRGGEVLKFRGDDDVWVYLDGRLVVDRGGIHFPKGDTVEVDGLPSSAGKQGQYRDLDVYFCSRIPSTSVFGMEVPLDPRPHPLKYLRITDTAGKELASKDVVVGKTRVCAGPVWEDNGAAACGNHQPPPAGFLSADWDLNGTSLSGPGGARCVDLDPSGFPHGTKVQLTARSGGKAARISLTLAKVARLKDGLLRGHGKAEWVEVPMDSGSGNLPEGLDVEFSFAGRDRYVRAYPASGAWLSGVLGSGESGPAGLTGFVPVEAVTRQNHFGKIVTQGIRLSDGMGPVLASARVAWNAEGSPAAWLEWEASEDLAASSLRVADLLGSRGGQADEGLRAFGLDAAAVPDEALALGAGKARFRLPLSEHAASAFRSGDSLSLAASVADVPGNAAPRFLVPILPAPRLASSLGGLRFTESPARGHFFVPVSGLPAVILVTPGGQAIRDLEADRKVAAAGGPILRLPTVTPLRRIDLAFHDNLGGMVGKARLDIGEGEWDALRRASPGETTWVNLMWYPVSPEYHKLGTGAYLVQGKVWTRDGALVQGAGGEWARVRGSLRRLGPMLFGYIRE